MRADIQGQVIENSVSNRLLYARQLPSGYNGENGPLVTHFGRRLKFRIFVDLFDIRLRMIRIYQVFIVLYVVRQLVDSE